MKRDIAVIGAGASGITSALVMARNGYNVTLIEKSKRTAPLLRGFSRKGIFFDTGFHYSGGLGDGESLDLLYRYLGLDGMLEKRPFNVEGFDLLRYCDTGFEFPFPTGRERILERFCALFPSEEKAVEEYFSSVREVVDSFPYLNLEIDGSEVTDFPGYFRRAEGPTLKEHLEGLTGDPLLRHILSAHCVLHGVPAEEVSFEYHGRIVGSLYRSVHSFTGGGESLVAAFDRALEENGVSVRCGRGVEKMVFSSDGRIKGVELEGGEEVACSACISTLHPRHFIELLPPGLFRPAYRNRMRNLGETISAFTVFGVCPEGTEELEGANILLFPQAEEYSFGEESPAGERPLFVSAAFERGGGNARGCVAICPASREIMAKWPAGAGEGRDGEYRQLKETVISEVCALIEEQCPGLAENFDTVECASPLTFRDYDNSPFGSLYGAAHRVGQFNPVTLTSVDGLYVAGQAVTGPGLLGATISGLFACGSILGHNKLREEIKRYA